MKVSKDHFGGNLTGICGNCNGHVKDDYQTKEGVDGGYADIGNSYKVLDCCHGWKANCNSINLKYTCVLYLYNKNDCLPYTIIQGLCN
jgi:hypothetical protein